MVFKKDRNNKYKCTYFPHILGIYISIQSAFLGYPKKCRAFYRKCNAYCRKYSPHKVQVICTVYGWLLQKAQAICIVCKCFMLTSAHRQLVHGVPAIMYTVAF